MGYGRRMLRRVEAELRGERVPVLLLRGDGGRALGQLRGLQQLYFGGHGGVLWIEGAVGAASSERISNLPQGTFLVELR